MLEGVLRWGTFLMAFLSRRTGFYAGVLFVWLSFGRVLFRRGFHVWIFQDGLYGELEGFFWRVSIWCGVCVGGCVEQNKLLGGAILY